jgi:hypothetical protein
MFMLTAAELDQAYAAINHHGYSTMLPDPPEWDTVKANWTVIRDVLDKIDLETYEPYKAMKVFAPKSRANIRIMHMLHPQDLLLYTALVLIAKNDIEANRLSVRAKRVFSYRVDIGKPNILYEMRGWREAYNKQLDAKAAKAQIKYVAIADIADFYPRIYQHRLENIVESVASTQRVRDVARVLVRKFIGNLMERNSYGIPVGPYASRLLGEAILIDVDATLQSQGVDFVRWVDDFNIFCKTEYEAQSILFSLGEWLFTNHGLTLQSSKTHILPIEKYKTQILVWNEEMITDRDTAVKALRDLQVGYEDVEDEELDPAEVEEVLAVLQSIDLKGILENSLAETELVDYQAVMYALSKLPRIPENPPIMKREVLELVLDNAELLYPVAEHIAKYILSFDDLTRAEQKRIASKLLKPLKSKRKPPQYYAMWILHIFASSPEWNHTKEIVALYAESTSEVVKRHAALAIHSSGNRSEALVVKDDYSSASPLLKLAILFASQKLGNDERKHWKLSNRVSGVIEKLI